MGGCLSTEGSGSASTKVQRAEDSELTDKDVPMSPPVQRASVTAARRRDLDRHSAVASGMNSLENVQVQRVPKTPEVTAFLMRVVRRSPLFSEMNDVALSMVVDSMYMQEVPKQTQVIVQGDRLAQQFYVIADGRCDVFMRDDGESARLPPEGSPESAGAFVRHMGPGDCFGELALLYDAPRSATVVTTSLVTMWVMDRHQYQAVKLAMAKQHLAEKLEMIAHIPLFEMLTPEQRVDVVDVLEPATFKPTEVVFKEGDVGSKFFILQSGRVEVAVAKQPSKNSKDEPQKRVIAASDKHPFFGELALISEEDNTRTATVTAVTNVKCMTMNRQAFIDLLGPLKHVWRLQALQRVPLLAPLSLQHMELLAKSLKSLEFRADEVIYSEGEIGETVFIVEKGMVAVARAADGGTFPSKSADGAGGGGGEGAGADAAADTTKKTGPQKLSKGEHFGETALVVTAPRTQTVRAVTDTTLLVLHKSAFKAFGASLEQLRTAWCKDTITRIFSGISDADATEMAAALVSRSVEKGARALNVDQEDSSLIFAIVEYGVVTVKGQKNDRVLMEVAQGAYVCGAILESYKADSPYVAASSPVSLLELPAGASAHLKGIVREWNLGLGLGSNTRIDIRTLKLRGGLGVGGFSRVYKVYHDETKQHYALKVVSMELIVKRGLVEHAIREQEIMRTLRHPSIVRIVSASKAMGNLYFVMDLVQGSDLHYFMNNYMCTEKIARFYGSQIILILEFLHRQYIIYRDLKPENLLIDTQGYLKLCDFGLAKYLRPPQNKTYTFCGTPIYLAPEVWSRVGHNRAADWWALGVILYEMVVGEVPYTAKEKVALMNLVVSDARVEYPPSMSTNCKEVIRGLLCYKPTQRFGMIKGGSSALKRHPFFARERWTYIENKTHPVPWVPDHANNPESVARCRITEEDRQLVPPIDTSPHALDTHFADYHCDFKYY
mmetsp:Transcript_11914/g.39205  ORF Transcript_11914/g.39205 Transcript_11914/m.39205 type:complete len:950 (-) Transcript_11914:163-3012(-)